VADTRLVRIEAREQRGTGGTATGAVISCGKSYAIREHPIDVGCPDLGSKTTDIRVAHVVGHNQDDIGSVRGH